MFEDASHDDDDDCNDDEGEDGNASSSRFELSQLLSLLLCQLF